MNYQNWVYHNIKINKKVQRMLGILYVKPSYQAQKCMCNFCLMVSCVRDKIYPAFY
jgi:hypothetical protein